MIRRRLAAIIALILTLTLGAELPAETEVQATLHLNPVKDLYPFWSPDGAHIVFHSNRAGGAYQIFVMRADGSGLKQLTNTPKANQTAVFSPDDKTIAFQSWRDGNAEIYLMNRDGSGQRNITNNAAEDSHPKWSADGLRIIFDSTRVDAKSEEVFEMRADGSDLIRRTEYADWDSYASLSPDGSRILWRRVTPTGGRSASGRNSEVFVMRRDGTGPLNITKHSAFDGYPAWSADGAWVYFASNRDGKTFEEFNIYRMRADGSELQRLTETIAGVEQVRPMPSPDGRRIVFNRDWPDGRVEIHILEMKARSD